MELLMITLTPDWAPNLHPLVVHFPIAILFFAALMDLISFVLPEHWWGEKKTAITYLAGGICTVLVLFTGHMAADSIDIPKAAYHTLGHHAGWATWTAWFFGIYAVVRFVTAFIERFQRPALHVVFFLISLVGLYFLTETAEHGGELVYKYGLGTPRMAKQTAQMDEPQTPGFHQGQNGQMSWMAAKNANNDLFNHFTFLRGDTTSLNAMAAKAGNGYQLQVSSPHFFFVTDSNSYSNIQMELTVDPGQYNGDIMLAHNVHDVNNYAYMVLHPDGSAQLGRFENGKNAIIEKGTFDWNGLKHIKLAVSGDHIHGYVNDKSILHGHSDQTGPGAVGLKLDGSGNFALRNLQISRITDKDLDHDGDEHKPQ